MNSLCRRAAAYSIGCRIQWRLRHITTDRNVGDEPSRKWGPDFERPRKLTRKRHSVDDATQGVHVDAGLLGLGSTPSVSSSCSPMSTSWWSSSAPSSTTSITTQSSTSGASSSLSALYFLEIFSCTGRLTQAVAEAGMRVLPDIEIAKGHQFDLLRPSSQNTVLDLIRDGRVWCVHFGTPRTGWSSARHNIKQLARAREKEVQGVTLALFTARAIPTRTPPRTSLVFICVNGASRMKPTSLMTSLESLQTLIRTCSRTHVHVALRGTERVVIQGKAVTRNRTIGAGPI